ncbi:primase C-terminal domain-containing protein [Aliarcobacter cryaerophilus]|uniref:primase C-terminal domain-containing protein n=1 Tax=Aliarcobacter cryaerophilus TaxID=28198 RepID=UPI0021B4B594|nr:replication initiation protein [Aliarcobacter cryaerophilus]MCT7526395.1 primase C-terminal domain-containing protein [Aliarcobacter cryaerophilus]MCT7541407.1 primase C-terminal domain-containing protein [Aliarcobacter cryaerophilus]
MTTLNKYKDDKEQLEELLIKNLPKRIKSGNEKYSSNFYEYSSAKSLREHKFINFNSSTQISFLVFDIDKFEDKTALEYFKNIDNFLEYITNNIGLEPTYILETQKGFHFAYHLKNHIFTHQRKPFKYTMDIKRAITKYLKCDEIASHRLYGVWRNPLLHTCYYSHKINYELDDFKKFIPKIEFTNTPIRLKVKIDENELIEGQRNNTLFKYAMRFAKGKKILTQSDILDFLININNTKQVNLPNSELNQIANSTFKYWQNGTIRYGELKDKEKNFNVGVMEFEKMKYLTYDEYLEETKRRQQKAAIRTLELRDKKKNKQQLLVAKEMYMRKLQDEKESLVVCAILDLEEKGLKVNVASISRVAKIDRRTAKKYFLAYGKFN